MKTKIFNVIIGVLILAIAGLYYIAFRKPIEKGVPALTVYESVSEDTNAASDTMRVQSLRVYDGIKTDKLQSSTLNYGSTALAGQLGTYSAVDINGTGCLYYKTHLRGSRNTYRIQLSNTYIDNGVGWSCIYVTYYISPEGYISDAFVTKIGYDYGVVQLGLGMDDYMYVILSNTNRRFNGLYASVDILMASNITQPHISQIIEVGAVPDLATVVTPVFN
jgi:hypothetical protein